MDHIEQFFKKGVCSHVAVLHNSDRQRECLCPDWLSEASLHQRTVRPGLTRRCGVFFCAISKEEGIS